MNINIVRTEINGVEYFVLPSGEAGMSISGLALLCGVGRQAVDNILQSVPTSSCSEFLKCLRDKELTLSTSSAYKNVTVLRDDVCATILEWYAFESQRTTKKARETYRKFAQAGIRVWIQKLANFEPSITTAKPSKTFELDWHKLSNAIETSVASAVKRELSNISEKVYRDYNQASLAASYLEPSGYVVDRIPTNQNRASSLTKEEQVTQAFIEILKIRDRWCEEVGIFSITNGDYAFTEAVKSGMVPDVDRLIPIIKWGTTNGISRGSLTRHRKQIAKNAQVRNLDRPKTTIIGSHPELETWVRSQRSAFPQEAVAGLHRRMQLQHPEICVSLTTLSRWLETEGIG